MTTQKIGIIGKGNVGSGLARGIERAGHDVRSVGNDPAKVKEIAEWASIVLLAMPSEAINDVLEVTGDAITGKTVIDATNALDAQMNLAVGFTTSGAEELQKKIPTAHVVKAFNTTFAQHMDSGKLGDVSLTAFVAGDQAESKEAVQDLARDIGFDPVDAGPLKNARLLEPVGYLNIQLGYVQGLGPDIGMTLARA